MRKASDKSINPYRLREARLFNGYRIKEVADMLNISRQLLSAYELGKIAINSDTLFQLYTIYKMPAAYYYKNNSGSHNRGQVYFRKFKTAMTLKNEQAETMAGIAIEAVVDFFKGKVQFPKPSAAIFKFKEKYTEADGEPDMEALAKIVRCEWNLGNLPIGNMTRLLEKKGFMVIELDFDEKIDGFSFWDNGVPFIFISKKENDFRKRFSLAHELCHLLFHDDELIQEKIKELEQQANRFASALLLPEDGFLESIRGSSLEELLRCKLYWKVSVGAMVKRLHFLQVISNEKYEYLEKMISRRHWRKNEPYDDCQKQEKPVLLKQAVFLIIDNKIIDKDNLLASFCISDSFAEDVCGLAKGYFSKNDSLVKPLLVCKKDD